MIIEEGNPFIEQYKELPWITEYLKGVIEKFSIEDVLQKITQETKISLESHCMESLLKCNLFHSPKLVS